YRDPDLDSTLTGSWMAEAVEAVGLQVEAVQTVGKGGGGWHEGYGYFWGAAGLSFPVELESWRTATGEDVFARTPELGNLALHLMYLSRPHDGLIAHVDKLGPGRLTSKSDEPTTGKHAYWSLLTARYRNGYAAFYAENATNDYSENYWPGNPPRQMMWDVIWEDKSVPPTPPDNSLPGARLFEGQGIVVMRSGFESERDVFAVFRARKDYGQGNRLACENSFLLHRNSSLAIRSGYYAGWSSDNHLNYYGSDLPGNTLEVLKPGVDFGGQRSQQGNTNFRTAVSLSLETTADYDLARGDASESYLTADNAERYFVRLKPEECFVVFDRVSAVDGQCRKKWVLHSVSEPVVSEPGEPDSVEVAGHIESYRGDLVTVDNGPGRLCCRILLPGSHRVRKVGGSGYEFWVDADGKNYPLSNIAESEAGSWRFEVVPDQVRTDDVFLHLLYPAAETDEPAPQAALLEGDTWCGLETSGRVVVFARETGGLDSLDYRVEAPGPLRHLLCDLQPGLYAVLRDGTSEGMFRVDDHRTLYFTSAGGGVFRVRDARAAGLWPPVDLDGDGDLNIFDLLIMLNLVGKPASENPAADLNNNSQVDLFDLLALLKYIALGS
ncbi:MAG: hypothetical protein JXQ83_00690, partial [Candidatus Glassbacteria bacterium]|nr:hypothetical protein [Candidatus Glassbacteria bacterium]